MIVLSGCGIRRMWQFPPCITKCPVKNCMKCFSSRSEAIVHFKTNHAERSVLCPICNFPKLMRKFSDIKQHYNRIHPNSKLPSYFVKPSMKMKKKSQRKSQPTKKVHKKSQLPCPLKHCSYETEQMSELCAHWTQNHGDLEFPQLRATADDISKSTIIRKVTSIQKLFYFQLIIYLFPFFGIYFVVQVNILQSSQINGNNSIEQSFSRQPRRTISISSESNLSNDGTPARQVFFLI